MAVQGKRLLVLGGTLLSNNIVETAHNLGVYVTVMDMDPNSPAKKISDDYRDISTANVDDVVKVFHETKSDGIYTSYEDFNTGIAAEACARLNIPFYASLEQIDATRNKLAFKALCRKHGIRTVEEYRLDESCNEEDLARVQYPAIIKPADSYAARGISVCRNEKELLESIPKALAHSRTHQVIVEKFMTGVYLSITFSIYNGIVRLSAMNDKAINTEQELIVPLPAAYIYPSQYIDLCNEEILPGLQKMIDDMAFRDSTFSIEAIVSDGHIYVFEMSYRIGGVNDWKFVFMENQVNHMEMFIRLALGEGFTGYDLAAQENPKFQNAYCLMNILAQTGKIKRIEGIEKVVNHPCIFRYAQNYTAGDEITWPGTLRQIFAKAFIRASSKKEILDIIHFVNDNLKIIDENENNLLMTQANWDHLCAERG